MARLCAEAGRISQPAMRKKGVELIVRAEEGSLLGDAALLPHFTPPSSTVTVVP